MRTQNKYWGKPFDAPGHPYANYEGTPLWRAVKKALADLEKNQDLSISEWHQYVVGYVCKQLETKGLVNRKSVQQAVRKRRAV
jgi:hypothetical protein